MLVTPNGNPTLPSPAMKMDLDEIQGVGQTTLRTLINGVENTLDAKDMLDVSFTSFDLAKNMLSGSMFKSIANGTELAWDAVDMPNIADALTDKLFSLMTENQLLDIENGFSKSLKAGTDGLLKVIEPMSNEIKDFIKSITPGMTKEKTHSKLDTIFAGQQKRIENLIKSEMDEEQDNNPLEIG